MSRSGSKTVDRIEYGMWVLSALQFIMIIVKLTFGQSWSFWIILMPIWIVPAVATVVFIVAAVMVVFQKGWRST